MTGSSGLKSTAANRLRAAAQFGAIGLLLSLVAGLFLADVRRVAFLESALGVTDQVAYPAIGAVASLNLAAFVAIGWFAGVTPRQVVTSWGDGLIRIARRIAETLSNLERALHRPVLSLETPSPRPAHVRFPALELPFGAVGALVSLVIGLLGPGSRDPVGYLLVPGFLVAAPFFAGMSAMSAGHGGAITWFYVALVLNPFAYAGIGFLVSIGRIHWKRFLAVVVIVGGFFAVLIGAWQVREARESRHAHQMQAGGGTRQAPPP